MITGSKVRRFQIVIAFALLFLVFPCDAQKKGGGASGGSPSAAATPATTVSNAPFEVEMLAYGALDKIDERLSNYACTLKPKSGADKYDSVVVLDPPALLALQTYDAFTVNARALASAFATMQGAAGAGGGIDDFADITNAVVAAAVASTTESSFSFTLQDPSAAIVLLNHLRSQNNSDVCKAAYYAGVYAVNEASKPRFHSQEVSSVSEQLDGLASLRTSTLKAIMTAGEATSAASRNAAGCAPIPAGTSVSTVGGAALYPFGGQDPCLAAFSSLDNSYNTFLQGLSTPNATTGQPALSSILQGFRMRALLASATVKKPVLGIYLSISAAGGTQQVRKNLLTALFTGEWIRYSGAVSVNVIVFEIANGDTAKDDKSEILLSDLIRYRTPLGHIKKPGNYDGSPEAGDNLSKIPTNP